MGECQEGVEARLFTGNLCGGSVRVVSRGWSEESGYQSTASLPDILLRFNDTPRPPASVSPPVDPGCPSPPDLHCLDLDNLVRPDFTGVQDDSPGLQQVPSVGSQLQSDEEETDRVMVPSGGRLNCSLKSGQTAHTKFPPTKHFGLQPNKEDSIPYNVHPPAKISL
ncbi:hypothetical protein AAG570_006388 [Ranatra chinensis]|uniref:Uncharacterized protein n=1 Tax=Ranatra chinensis TaxID=642074 RepID=A0ABD0YTU2_9HEMI